MDARTLEALQASIAKWEKNAVAETWDDAQIFTSSCPLCHIFNNGTSGRDCRGCPVSKRTGRDGCEGSPWDGAHDAYRDWERGRGRTDAAAFHDAARAEAAFLRSLLPLA